MERSTVPQVFDSNDEESRPEFIPATLKRALTLDDCKHAINKEDVIGPFLEKRAGDILYFSFSDPTNHLYNQEHIKRSGLRLQPDKTSPLISIPKDAFEIPNHEKNPH